MMENESSRDRLLKTTNEYRSLLIPYIASLVGSLDAAEDVFQETMVVICRKWKDYTPGTNVRAWCLEIARRSAAEWRRRDRHEPLSISEEALSALTIEAFGESEEESRSARLDSLEKCLRKLPKRAHELLRFRYGRGLSCREIARKKGWPVNSLYVALSRLRARLRECVYFRQKVGTA